MSPRERLYFGSYETKGSPQALCETTAICADKHKSNFIQARHYADSKGSLSVCVCVCVRACVRACVCVFAFYLFLRIPSIRCLLYLTDISEIGVLRNYTSLCISHRVRGAAHPFF